MKMKDWFAMTAGALATVMTGMVLWAVTTLPAQDVIFLALGAFFVGAAMAAEAAERMEHKERMPHGDPHIVTLRRDEWERGRRA